MSERQRFLSAQLPETLSGRERTETYQPRIFHRRLTVFDRLSIYRIVNHFDEGGHRGIFGNKAEVPALFGGTNQRQFELALPNNPATRRINTGLLSRP